MICNQKRYIELYKRSENLKKQKILFFNGNNEEYFEFIRYEAAIESYIFWKKRRLFLLLMEKFVNRNISGEEFNESFCELRLKLLNEVYDFLEELRSEKVINFYPDPRSHKFASLISFFNAECDNFTNDYQNEKFYDFIKDNYLKLKEALLNEE